MIQTLMKIKLINYAREARSAVSNFHRPPLDGWLLYIGL